MALVWYGVAKIFEHFDTAIFQLLKGWSSGHTLKHLAAAMATYEILRYVKLRKRDHRS